MRWFGRTSRGELRWEWKWSRLMVVGSRNERKKDTTVSYEACYSPGGVLLLRLDPPVECLLCKRLPPRDDPREESPDDENKRFSAKPRRRWKSAGFLRLLLECGEVGDWVLDDAVYALTSCVCCAAGISLQRHELLTSLHLR
jgi:hypothetical protein